MKFSVLHVHYILPLNDTIFFVNKVVLIEHNICRLIFQLQCKFFLGDYPIGKKR